MKGRTSPRIWALLLLVFLMVPAWASRPRPRVHRPGSILRNLKAAVRNIDLRRLRRIPPGRMHQFKRRVFPLRKIKRKLGGGSGFDPVVQLRPSGRLMPAPLITFEGLDMSNWGSGWPPDTNGDVGKSNVGANNKGYYIQTVNTSIGIFDKSDGTRVAAFTFDDFFDGTNTPCDDNNVGDPVVLYDRYLDRWIITDFAWTSQSDPYECFAMSKTNDPVSGGWYMWGVRFNEHSGTSSYSNLFNDYPKMGVWNNGYYVTFNDFTSSFVGVTVWALDKNSLASGSMTLVAFFLDINDDNYAASLLPANAKSPTGPPSGSPNYLVSIGDDAWGGNISSDSIAIYRCSVDWNNPSGATLTGPTVVDVASFDYNMCGGWGDSCIPQKNSSEKLDAISDRAMYSAFYWNYGDHETIVFVHTVDADGNDHAGVRWYELRNPGGTNPSVYQQGTYAPDSNHRWMGSAACDANGNIAIGYSVSSSNMYPDIRYAGHKAGDPLGEMTQGESVLQAGGGSQSSGYGRWGDYSMLTIDPDDNLTFWYTTEYYQTTGNQWHTKIGSFKFAPADDHPPSVSITNPSNGDTVSGNVTITADASDDNGIAKVEFYIDGTLKYTDTSSPYEYTWDSSSTYDDDHTIKVIAYDTASQLGQDEITVTTDNGVAPPMLVVDLDGNTNSCTYIRDLLENKGYSVDYETSMPSKIPNGTPATWVCLGIYSQNHQLTDGEGDLLKSYLDSGGRVYMEGGDTWCYDDSTSVHPYFGTWLKGDSGCEDGNKDLATINGVSGTFTDGMSWDYSGDNNWIDHIGANQSDSFNIWDNSSPSYHTGVARDNATSGYRTIAASHEFGGAESSDRSDIMDKYLEFFFGGGTDNPPTVSFQYPQDGYAVYSVIKVRAHAEDDQGVSKVEFYLDDTLQSTYTCSGTTCDAVWTWDTTQSSVGNHTLKAIAYDTANQTGDQSITVNVHPGYGAHFGGPNDDFGYSIAIDQSRSYVYMAGLTYSYGSNPPNYMIYRVLTNGIVQGRYFNSGGQKEYGYGVAVDGSGNVYLAGYTSDGTQNDILVYKFDSSMNELWSKTLGGSGNEVGYDIAVDSDGNVIVVGYSESYSNGSTDAIVYKLNGSDGSVIWMRHYGGGGVEEGRGVAVDSSKNIYVVGYTSSFSYGERDVAIWKVDPDGTRLWGRHFGGTDYDEGRAVAVSGSYVYITGWTQSFTWGGHDIVVYKINASNGARVAAKHYGGSSDDNGESIVVDGNGNVIVVGETQSFGHGGIDIAVYSLASSNLARNWAKPLGGSNSEFGLDVAVDSDNNIYIVGYGNSYTYGSNDFILYKLNSSGVKLPVSSGQ